MVYNSYIPEQPSYCPFSYTYSINEKGRIKFILVTYTSLQDAFSCVRSVLNKLIKPVIVVRSFKAIFFFFLQGVNIMKW